MKFRKITALAGSLLMAGLTVATAAAANYPAPFVDNGVADVAIVYGTGAGVSSLDMVQAGNIQSSLGTFVSAKGTTTVTGGEVYPIMKTSDNLNLGDSIMSVLSEGKLDNKDFSTLLADGIYEDNDGTEYDFNQKIYVANETFELIRDKDYKDKDPTLGMFIDKDGPVMTYNVTFEDPVNYTLMPTSDLEILGKKYYVLTASSSTIELLDSASSQTMNEGETITVTSGSHSYQVSVAIYTDGARFTVDGETTDKLSAGDYDKLAGDVYLVAKSVDYSSKETGVSSAEFSIGQGKIVLGNGDEVKINDDSVDKFKVNITTGSSKMTQLAFQWNAEEKTYLTGEEGYTEIVMPVFSAAKLIVEGFNFPSEAEEAELSASDEYITLDAEIEEGALNLPILYRASSTDDTFDGLGEDSETILVINNESDASFNVFLNESEDTSFVATYIKNDEAYTYAFQLDSVDEKDGEATVTLSGLAGEDSIELEGLADYADRGDITFTLLSNVTDVAATITVSTTVSGAKVHGDRIVTKKGLQIMLPTLANINGNTTANPVYNLSSWDMNFTEANIDGDIALGGSFTATISSIDDDGMHVSDTSISEVETLDADMYVGYVFSDLATKIEMDKSGETNTFVVMYNGEEVTADVSITSADAAVTSEGASALGDVLVKDSEVQSVASKNLVIVGGSCINSAAATVLGGAYCGAAFTANTGVATGEFLIKGVQDAYTAGKLALVVAGYEAADTVNAATYLTKKTVDTSKVYKGTSETNAELVIA